MNFIQLVKVHTKLQPFMGNIMMKDLNNNFSVALQAFMTIFYLGMY